MNTESARESARRRDGKFGEQVRAEETGVRLATPPSADEVRVFDVDGRREMAATSYYSANSLLRHDDGSGYHEAWALADAEAYVLATADEVAEPHEVAHAAYTEHIEPGPKSIAEARAHLHGAEDPDDGLTWTQARAASNHFLRRSINTADQIVAARRRGDGDEQYRQMGYLNGAVRNAVAFRYGEPSGPSPRAEALADHILDEAEERAVRPRGTTYLASVADAEAAWDATEDYPGHMDY